MNNNSPIFLRLYDQLLQKIKKKFTKYLNFSENLKQIIIKSQKLANEIIKQIANNRNYVNNLISKIKTFNEQVLEIYNSNCNLKIKKQNEKISSIITRLIIDNLNNRN